MTRRSIKVHNETPGFGARGPALSEFQSGKAGQAGADHDAVDGLGHRAIGVDDGLGSVGSRPHSAKQAATLSWLKTSRSGSVTDEPQIKVRTALDDLAQLAGLSDPGATADGGKSIEFRQ